jgi:hypothetical protein
MTERYLNGKIYSIRSYLSDDIYIGSSCLSLPKRLYEHRKGYKAFLLTGKKHISSFDVIKYDDHYIELIQLYPCGSRSELQRKEGEYIRSMPCVNKVIAGRTLSEWREDNKEHLAQKHKKFYEDNKEELKIKQKIYNEEHKEDIFERNKIYNAKNKEEISAKKKVYRESHKGKIAEKDKLYRESNKEKLLEKGKKYREAHKDEIIAARTEKVTCECGIVATKGNMSRHKSSARHIKLLSALSKLKE